MKSKTDELCERILTYLYHCGRPVSNKELTNHCRAHRSMMYYALVRLIKEYRIKRTTRGVYVLIDENWRPSTNSSESNQLTVFVNGFSVRGSREDIRELLGMES